jgi:hypothetical protein
MVPFWDLSGHINDLTSKKTPLTVPQNLIAKLFGQQPVDIWLRLPAVCAGKMTIGAVGIRGPACLEGLWQNGLCQATVLAA